MVSRLFSATKCPPHIKTYFHLFIACVIFLIIFFGLSPINGLTQDGVKLLAIVVPTIYMWLFINTHWVSLLFLASLALTGIMTPNEVWTGSLGHFSIMLVLTFSIMSECLSENGVIQKIATWFMTRKFIQGRPYAFIGMYFASNLIIGIFMQNLALAVIFVTLTVQICERLDIQKGSSLYKCLMLGTFWGNGVLSIASPIAKTLPNILIGLVYTNFGIEITYAQWLLVGIPFSAVMFVIIMLCIRLVNPDTTPLKNFNIETAKKDDVALGPKGRIALVGMLLLILIILLPEILLILSIFTGFAHYLSQLGPIIPAIVVLVLLSIIQVKENDQVSPVLDFVQCTKKVPFTLLIFVASVVIMGVPMASDGTGFIPWLQTLLLPLTDHLLPFMLLIALVLLAVILTNFLSNTVVLTVFISLGTAIFTDHVIDPIVFSVIVAFAACMTCLTPSATITAPLFYGPEHLKVKEVVGINLLFLTLTTGLLIAMLPLVVAVVGN